MIGKRPRSKHRELSASTSRRIRNADARAESASNAAPGEIQFKRWPNLIVDRQSPMARFLIGQREQLMDPDAQEPNVRRMMFGNPVPPRRGR
jgi:hypothetical protein